MHAILLSAAALLASGSDCPPDLSRTCELVAAIATEMTQSLAASELAVGDFKLESFSAAGPVLRVVQRATYTATEFAQAFAAPGRSSSEYVRLLRESTLQINCAEPTRGIVDGGGSIVTTILFKDGSVLDVHTVSTCPAARR